MPSQQSIFEQMREEAEAAIYMTDESRQLLLKCIDDGHLAIKKAVSDRDFRTKIPFDVALVTNAAMQVARALDVVAETRRSATIAGQAWVEAYVERHQTS
ncbi:MAG: hypothetical protein ABIQ04_02945 [Candidatus Saccharimonadales bacterium]